MRFSLPVEGFHISKQHSSFDVITKRRKDLLQILPFNLIKDLGYPACFELVKTTICLRLHFENSFHLYEFLAL